MLNFYFTSAFKDISRIQSIVEKYKIQLFEKFS